MKTKKLIFSVLLLCSTHGFADYQKIISDFKIAPTASQQEFNSRLYNLESAYNRADQQRAITYSRRNINPVAYNSAICNSLEYSQAWLWFAQLNPLYVSQTTLDTAAGNLIVIYGMAQNARCSQIANKPLPAAQLGQDFFKKNLSTETIKYISDFEKNKKKVFNNFDIENLKVACQNKYYLTQISNLYKDNYKRLGQREFLHYQVMEKGRLTAINLLQAKQLEASCIDGYLNIEEPIVQKNISSPAPSIPQQPTYQAPSQPKMSNEQLACGITGILIRSLDKKATTDCN